MNAPPPYRHAAVAAMTADELDAAVDALNTHQMHLLISFAWGFCPEAIERSLGNLARQGYAVPGACADPGCGHARASHWEHGEPQGTRSGCSLLGCKCDGYLDPAAVAAIASGAPVTITDDVARCGSRPYPAGSEGDDGTECQLPRGHDGPHDDAAEAADPGYLEDAAAQDEDPAYPDVSGGGVPCPPASTGMQDPAPVVRVIGDEDGGCLMPSPTGSTECMRTAGHDVILGTPHRNANGNEWDDTGWLPAAPGTQAIR